MRYSFRLAEVVGHVPDPRRRPGTIKAICDYTGLDRHQVAALLKNEVKYIPLDALSKLCAYLIERGFAKADELPGRLFGVEPEHFWELLARRRRLELCLGVRRGDADDTLDDAWVVASDSVLLGELLNGATTLGGTAGHADQHGRRRGRLRAEPPLPASTRPHPEYLHQSLVWSPGPGLAGRVPGDGPAASIETFCEAAGDKALVCLGSNKSNPVVETLVASAFGCEPFVSQDGHARVGEAKLPDLPAVPRQRPAVHLLLRRPEAGQEPGQPKAGHLLRAARRRLGLLRVGREQAGRGLRVLCPSRVARADGNGPGRFLRPGHAAAGPPAGPPRRRILAARLFRRGAANRRVRREVHLAGQSLEERPGRPAGAQADDQIVRSTARSSPGACSSMAARPQ